LKVKFVLLTFARRHHFVQ